VKQLSEKEEDLENRRRWLRKVAEREMKLKKKWWKKVKFVGERLSEK